MQKTALVVGASGIGGSNLATELIDKGWTVYGLSRRPHATALVGASTGRIPSSARLVRRHGRAPIGQAIGLGGRHCGGTQHRLQYRHR